MWGVLQRIDLVVIVIVGLFVGGSDSGVLLILTVTCPGDVVGESWLEDKLSLSSSSSAGLVPSGGVGLPSVLLFLFAALPRTINTLSNLVCGRLISARIELTSTNVGDLLWRFARLFPP